MSGTPRLAVTVGDPRGIGPEIVAKMLRDGRAAREAALVVVGPSGAGVDVTESVGSWRDGSEPALAGRLAGAAIERAVAMAIAGTVDGIVTAPIDKSVLLAGGYDFPGHTEMLAALTGSQVAMMLTSAEGPAGHRASNALRVVLATTHIALRAVPTAVTRLSPACTTNGRV